LAWETLLPDWKLFPVTWHTFDMRTSSLSVADLGQVGSGPAAPMRHTKLGELQHRKGVVYRSPPTRKTGMKAEASRAL